MLAAITLLPALLGLAGPTRRAVAGASRPTPRRGRADGRPPFWARWATHGRATTPGRSRSPAVAVLLTLAAPFLWIRYGQSDDGTAPAGSTQRIAYDLIAEGYGPGANGPLARGRDRAGAATIPSSKLVVGAAGHAGGRRGRAAADERRGQHDRDRRGPDERTRRAGDDRPRRAPAPVGGAGSRRPGPRRRPTSAASPPRTSTSASGSPTASPTSSASSCC